MGTTAQHLRRTAKFGLLLAVVVSLSACTRVIRNHGYVPTDEELAEVVVGVDTRDTVAETVGTPSSSGMLNDSGYYYVRSRIEHLGLREPRVIERQLVAISFSSNGVVENIERLELRDGQPVRFTRRVTETNVESSGLLRQLLGNFTNFNPDQFIQ